jgi:hypothetical protein
MAFLSESDDIPRLLTRGTTQTFRIGFFTPLTKYSTLTVSQSRQVYCRLMAA